MRSLIWEEIYDHFFYDREDLLAWASLERRVRPWAVAALSDRGHEVVEDAVADTCSTVLVTLDQARGRATFGGFCYGQFLNVRQRLLSEPKGMQPLGEHDVDASEEELPDPTEFVLLKECLDWLREAHPKEGHAVHLKFYEDQPADAIAAVIGIRTDYACQMVFRGLTHLRKCLRSKLSGQYATS